MTTRSGDPLACPANRARDIPFGQIEVPLNNLVVGGQLTATTNNQALLMVGSEVWTKPNAITRRDELLSAGCGEPPGAERGMARPE